MSPAEYKDFQRAKAFNLEIVKSPSSSDLLALLSKKLINPPQHPSATPRKRPVFELNMVNYCTALNRLAKVRNGWSTRSSDGVFVGQNEVLKIHPLMKNHFLGVLEEREGGEAGGNKRERGPLNNHGGLNLHRTPPQKKLTQMTITRSSNDLSSLRSSRVRIAPR